MQMEIRICGFGGQGIIRTGLILATAACVYGDKNAVQTASYGPESRGGRCKSEVIISSEEIDFPWVYHPDILVAMSQEAYTEYVKDLKKNGLVLVDPGLVLNYKNDQRVKSLKVPATRIAEKLGNKIVANVVMIGALVAITRFLDMNQVTETIKKTIPSAFIEINLLALRNGYEYGKKLL
jgi:2-oxoglutarate ferredoxin oxidoreductase subunit gamma